VRLPPNGRAATVGVAHFGLVHGGACVRACWPAMLAMAVVPGSQMLLWTALLAGLMTAEKVARRPKLTARAVAIVLGLSAVVAVAVT
jgi:predicted metal-binding membrane protein